MVRDDVLAYLVVLDHPPVMAQLSRDDIWTGREHQGGCLLRIQEQLQDDKFLLNAVKERERLNGLVGKNNPQLLLATAECANSLYQILTEMPKAERPYAWAR